MALWQSLKKAQEQSKGTIQDYWHTVMALWQSLKKAQEQSKGTIQDYCVSVMALWQYLKESPGAIQRYYPRLLCVSDGIMTVP